MTKSSMIGMVALGAAGLAVLTGPEDAPLRIAQAAAQTAPSAISEAQDVNDAAGVVAEIVQCKRDSAGVLSIRMRFRNTGNAEVTLGVIKGANYDQYYVTGGNKKYFVLRDSEENTKTRSRTRSTMAAGSRPRSPRAAHSPGSPNIRPLRPR